ncbi:MAG: hypothetical protein ACM3P1_04535 [Candidatus Saccharibacteria bacterium]
MNRIKKNDVASDKDIRTGQAKKIPLNTNRVQGTQKKSTSKGHVIKLENKENRIHPVDSTAGQNRRTYPKNAPSSTTNTENIVNTPVMEPPVLSRPVDNNKSQNSAERFTISDKTGLWLLIAAAIFLIAWVIVFFYYHIGGNSHMLLAFAIICAVISLAGNKKKTGRE